MIKKIFLISFFYLGVSNDLKAQFQVKNATNEPIYVAYAIYENTSSFKGWTSKGWYKVVPGETKTIIGWLFFSGGTIYLHAHSDSWTWGRNTNLWVDMYNAFKIKNCNMEYHRNNNNYTKKQFFKLYTGDSSSYTYTFRL